MESFGLRIARPTATAPNGRLDTLTKQIPGLLETFADPSAAARPPDLI